MLTMLNLAGPHPQGSLPEEGQTLHYDGSSEWIGPEEIPALRKPS